LLASSCENVNEKADEFGSIDFAKAKQWFELQGLYEGKS